MQNTILSRPTKLKFDDKVLSESLRILSAQLADFLNLALMTKQAHWNMRGQNFIAVHEMLDPFNEKLLEYADTFAERIVQMGGTANGTVETIIAETNLSSYPTDIYDVSLHLQELIKHYSIVANNLRRDIDAGKADAATIDYFTQAVEDIDKYVWFLESHIE